MSTKVDESLEDLLYQIDQKAEIVNHQIILLPVDLLSDNVIQVHRAGEKEPTVYRRGDSAEAEPAVPGWTIAVDNLFPED